MATTRAPRTSASKSGKRKRRNSSPQAERSDFPYFAHEQLEVSDFPINLGLPVGKPGWAPAPEQIANSLDGGWKDEDEFLNSKEYAADESNAKDGKGVSRVSLAPSNQNPYKRLKTTGGRPALAKKVTADLDSDDELIVRMKNAKYLEKDIAQRLMDEGRIRYNAKTIGTRYARLKKKLQEKNDELLDADLTDWHDGDDDALSNAKRMADKDFATMMADLEARRWKMVADNLKILKPVTNFSQNACKARFVALGNGTARATPESIADPDEEVKARIAARTAREAKIEFDKTYFRSREDADPEISALAKANWEGNAWTSKKKVFK